MMAVYSRVNKKLVMYQSSDDFNATKVNKLLSSDETLTFYEEHSNSDYFRDGAFKL